jgi:hypothetical protein
MSSWADQDYRDKEALLHREANILYFGTDYAEDDRTFLPDEESEEESEDS